jgi:predicted DNA-binding transcriptional regulator YafY
VPRGNQLIRQWKLIQLLSGQRGRTLAQFQAELGVSKRTVQRDLEVIGEAGFPVTSELRNGTVFWRFVEGFAPQSPITLTLTEQMALYFSRGLFKPLAGTPMYESLESAMHKIGSQLPPQGLRFLREMGAAISVSSFGGKDYSRSRQVIEALTHAVFHKLTVRLSHRTPQHKRPVEREVDPYRLWYVNNALYVVGHDHWKNDLRVFAVDRIGWAKPTNRRFEVPEDFNFEKFTETAFNMIWGEAQEVKIRFSPAQAPYIRERTWHPGQRIDTQPDGSIILTINVGDIGEVKRWLIGFGAEAEVLKPEGLSAEIAAEFRKVASSRKQQGDGTSRKRSNRELFGTRLAH